MTDTNTNRNRLHARHTALSTAINVLGAANNISNGTDLHFMSNRYFTDKEKQAAEKEYNKIRFQLINRLIKVEEQFDRIGLV